MLPLVASDCVVYIPLSPDCNHWREEKQVSGLNLPVHENIPKEHLPTYAKPSMLAQLTVFC